jgi:hypothetical protein
MMLLKGITTFLILVAGVDVDGSPNNHSVDTGDGVSVNPISYKDYFLNPDRKPFIGNDPTTNNPEDTCGLTCRGPDQYSFGLFACLQTKYEDEQGNVPDVVLDEDSTIVLPKIIFSPSTSFVDLSLDDYNQGRKTFLGSR